MRVHFCHYITNGDGRGSTLRQPYCCYLSIEQWERCRELSFEKFAEKIIERLEERITKPKADRAKLDSLRHTITQFSR